jgi:hypothetical protein
VAQLTEHLAEHKKDYSSRRGLLAVLSQRKQMMLYLQVRERGGAVYVGSGGGMAGEAQAGRALHSWAQSREFEACWRGVVASGAARLRLVAARCSQQQPFAEPLWCHLAKGGLPGPPSVVHFTTPRLS